MMSLKYCFSYTSLIRKNITEIFLNDYMLLLLYFYNDRSDIMSRFDYVERNEPRRSSLNIFYKIVCVSCNYLISTSL